MDVHRFRAFSGIFGCFRALFGQTGSNGEFILYYIRLTGLTVVGKHAKAAGK